MGIDSKTLGVQTRHSPAAQRSVQHGRHILVFRAPKTNPRHGDYAPSWVKHYSFDPFTNAEYVNGARSPFYRGARSYYELPLHLQTHVYTPYVPSYLKEKKK